MSFLGRHHSEESKRKMRKASNGKNNPMYGVCRKGCGLGRKLSKETKEKMRQARIGRFKGKNHSQWKGGKKADGYGYILIWKPSHPRAMKAGYVRRSHLVAEETLGRYLYPDEITHHKNGIVDDDRPGNIEVTNQSKHTSSHNKNREGNQRRNALGQFARE